MSDLSQSLIDAAAAVLPAAYDESCGVPERLRTAGQASTSPEDWQGEARAAVVAVLEALAAAEKTYGVGTLEGLAADVRGRS